MAAQSRQAEVVPVKPKPETVFTGAVDAIADEIHDAANAILTKGVVGAFEGAFSDAVAQGLTTIGAVEGVVLGCARSSARAVPPSPAGGGSFSRQASGGSFADQAGCWGMLAKGIDEAIAGAIDFAVDDVKGAAKSISERGLVRAVGGAVAEAVEILGCAPPAPAQQPGGGGPMQRPLPELTRGRDIPLPEQGKLDAPVLGSAQLPSRGSASHGKETCKPCAFVVQGTCKNDVECLFCHLCEPGEKKRRRKVWLKNKREAQGMKDESSSAGSSSGSPTDSPPSGPASTNGPPWFRGRSARLQEANEPSLEQPVPQSLFGGQLGPQLPADGELEQHPASDGRLEQQSLSCEGPRA